MGTLYKEYRNINYLNPIFTICKFLGASPLFSIKTTKYHRGRIVYPICLSIFLSIIVALTFTEYILIQTSRHVTTTVMGWISNVFFLVSIFYTIIYICGFKMAKIRQFVADLKQFDVDYSKYYAPDGQILKRKVISTNVELILCLVFIHVYFFKKMYYYLTSEPEMYKYYVLYDILHIQVFLVILQYKQLINWYDFRYIVINNRLKTFLNECRTIRVTIRNKLINGAKIVPRNKQTIYNINYLNETYTMVSELTIMVHRFNDIFGWQILLEILRVSTHFLMQFNLTILFVFGDDIYGLKHGDASTQSAWRSVFWASKSILEIYLLIHTFDATTKEGLTSPLICYEIIEELLYFPPNEENSAILERTELLCKLVTRHRPIFSAAGFYDLNYTTYTSFISGITAYLIVLLQLR